MLLVEHSRITAFVLAQKYGAIRAGNKQGQYVDCCRTRIQELSDKVHSFPESPQLNQAIHLYKLGDLLFRKKDKSSAKNVNSIAFQYTLTSF